MTRYIEADLLMDALVNKGQTNGRYDVGQFWELNGREIREVIDSLPTADVLDVKHGSWCEDRIFIEGERDKYKFTGETIDCFYCSWCGYQQYYKTNFCPHCGTKMDRSE